MSLLLDILGFLGVLLRGVEATLQALTLGGIAFVVLLARPLRGRLGAAAAIIEARAHRLAASVAFLLAAAVLIDTALNASAVAGVAGLGPADALGAGFVLAGLARAAAALAAGLLLRRNAGASSWALCLAGLGIVAATIFTSHAAARLDDRVLLGLTTALHIIGASVWIGGIPYLLIGLSAARAELGAALIGRRFSLMAMGSVATLLAAGIGLALAYIDSLQAIYGTAYGVMVSSKVLLFGCLLALGAANYLAVERLRRHDGTSALRLRRFAEAEIGIGITVFFTAASLTSAPPAVDLVRDRVTWPEIVERLTPDWPRLTSPDHATLAIVALQAKLDAETAAGAERPQAFVPGAGLAPPRNAMDIAWSEYNHHWAGLFVTAIGVLGLAYWSGKAPWARHWPLLFLLLAGFLFIRSDPEVWPLGEIGFLASLRDPEVVQHRFFVVLLVAFALFEWGVRVGWLRRPGAALVFPLLTSLGGGLLLAHQHSLGNVREELLIELTHFPLALLGIIAGWARWLELRLAPGQQRLPGAVWPVCFLLIGLVLLAYREA